MTIESEMNAARSWIRECERPIVMTGAGVSAESGVPTFRDAGGLWRNHRPEELATPEAFDRDPELVWSFYSWRRSRLRHCEPNAGHFAIAEMERSHPDMWLVTQNVDGLHRRAGSSRVVELHGDIMIDRCENASDGACSFERPARVSEVVSEEGEDGPPQREPPQREPPQCEPPRCDQCGGRLRPGVVWFGEPVPAIEKCFELASAADLVLVVGTSGVVEPAASVARVARGAGAKVIDVNIEPSMLTEIADSFLRGASAEILPRLLGESPAR